MSLTDILSSLRDRMRNSKTTVGSSQGPLPQPAKSIVAADLGDAQGEIADALALISNAGAANTKHLPATLPLIADRCDTLSDEAYAEAAGSSNPDLTYIGNRIKTVEWLIDVNNGYKCKAGI